jgi:hypothetical protein
MAKEINGVTYTGKTGIKIKCCVCAKLVGDLHSDHLTAEIIKEVEVNGFHDGENCYACDDCNPEFCY